MEKLTGEKLTKIYIEYCKFYSSFCSINQIYDFTFSLNEFEIIHTLLADAEGLDEISELTKKEYHYNAFVFAKIFNKINLENSLENAIYIFSLYRYCLFFISQFQLRCLVATNDSRMLWRELSNLEILELQKEQKYKTEQMLQVQKSGGTFKNTFLVWQAGFSLPVTNILKHIDSIRKELLEAGDTLESIYNRDLIITLIKYYETISKGINDEQNIRTN